MDKTVIDALHQLNAALDAAAYVDDVAILNAYSVFEQEVNNAASRCAQSLYWAAKAVAK